LDVIRTIVGFRIAHGLLERPVYREFFASGLTVFDTVGAAGPSSPPNFLARVEVQNLIREIGLTEDRENPEEAAFHEIELEMEEANK
jgi:chromosome partitioning protein